MSRGQPYQALSAPFVRFSHLSLWLTGAFVVIAIVWANFASLEEIARAEGRVIPSSQTQFVQNLEGGILRRILVEEGERVTKGQVLLQIDDTRFASTLNESIAASSALRFRILRLTAELAGTAMSTPVGLSELEQQSLDDERALYQSRQEELASSLGVLNQQLNQHRQTRAELMREVEKLEQAAAYAQQELLMTATSCSIQCSNAIISAESELPFSPSILMGTSVHSGHIPTIPLLLLPVAVAMPATAVPCTSHMPVLP